MILITINVCVCVCGKNCAFIMQASAAEFHFIFQTVVFWSNLPLLRNDLSDVVIKTI